MHKFWNNFKKVRQDRSAFTMNSLRDVRVSVKNLSLWKIIWSACLILLQKGKMHHSLNIISKI